MTRQDYQVTDLIMDIHQIPLHGNITPLPWFHHITHKNGKPNLVAITILSDIVYWYRPTEVRDEETGNFVGWKSKFRGDMLQRSYKQLSERFGITRTQAKDAVDYLISIDVLHREFRTIEQQGVINNNVMFVAPIAEGIRKISESEDRKLPPPRIEPRRGVDTSEEPSRMYPKTNTYTSSNTTTETSKNGINQSSIHGVDSEKSTAQPEQTGMDEWMDGFNDPKFNFLWDCGLRNKQTIHSLIALPMETLQKEWEIVKNSTVEQKAKPGILSNNLKASLIRFNIQQRAAAERAANPEAAQMPTHAHADANRYQRPDFITEAEWDGLSDIPAVYALLDGAQFDGGNGIECRTSQQTDAFYRKYDGANVAWRFAAIRNWRPDEDDR